VKAESKRIYAEALDRLIDAIPTGDRESVRSSLGSEVEKGFPNTYAFAVALLAQEVKQTKNSDD
jgi:hypothetical protein